MRSDQDEMFGRWRNALADMLNNPSSLTAWQDRRYRFAHHVGELLVGASPSGIPVTEHVVYGVCVAGSGLVYVGQTGDARRRLRDLPVGESHHVAPTIPPEIWQRVVVVQWPTLLSRISAGERRAAEQLGRDRCGLAMEYGLQVTYRPVLGLRRRGTAGEWVARDIERSRSRGAVASSELPELFSEVREHWDELARAKWNGHGDPVIYLGAGRVVFPRDLP